MSKNTVERNRIQREASMEHETFKNELEKPTRVLKCPFCHHDRFRRTTIDEVKMVDDGESITDELLSGHMADGSDAVAVDIRYVCINCGTDVTEMELEGSKKPKCPKCQKEIDSLGNFCKQTAEYTLTVENGYPQYEHESTSDSGTDEEYTCPECNEALFTNEEDAVSFLKGETIQNEPIQT